jgi:hypothetical protein
LLRKNDRCISKHEKLVGYLKKKGGVGTVTRNKTKLATKLAIGFGIQDQEKTQDYPCNCSLPMPDLNMNTIINRAQFKQNLGTTISGIFCFSRIELSTQIYEPVN